MVYGLRCYDRAVCAVRAVILAASLSACGRFGFHQAGTTDAEGSGDVDAHLHAASGWAITPLVELTGAVPYDATDFTDGGSEILDNAPRYVCALYPPFAGSVAVLAGRSLIELTAAGALVVHDYRPATPDTTGPDAPARATFADLGAGAVGLWLSSASLGGGDGLYLIASDWSITIDASDTVDGRFNNLFPIALDPTGSFDATAVATLYEVEDSEDELMRRTASEAATTLVSLPGAADDLAVIGDAMYATIENADDTAVALDRVGPGASYVVSELASTTSLVLAEGSTDAGLYGILDGAAFVAVSGTDGTMTQEAWSDDAAWVWQAVSAPRAGHAYARQFVVLESNRTLDRDRLLLVTAP